MMRLVALALALAALVPCAPARAHGVAAFPVDEPVRALRFGYSDGSPMAYAEVSVFAPAKPDIEFAVGRTDARGRFAFVPHGAGQWLVAASDGMGHRAETRLQVAEPTAASSPTAQADAPPAGTASLTMRAVLGLSLLANVFLGLGFARRRRT
jgi:nickel transport protein